MEFKDYLDELSELKKVLSPRNKIELIGTQSQTAAKLVDDYDFYTGFIDDSRTKARAEQDNKTILKSLNDMGVTSFIYKDYRDFSGKTVGITVPTK